MSIDTVRAVLARAAPDIEIIELPVRTGTVDEAAAAHGVSPGQIAKTLSLRMGDRYLIVVVRGDARLDNRKARAAFGGKVRMLDVAEVPRVTGHPVGGVSPLGLPMGVEVFCDRSLLIFNEVMPAAGSVNSAIRITPERLAALTGATWVDICQSPDDGRPPRV